MSASYRNFQATVLSLGDGYKRKTPFPHLPHCVAGETVSIAAGAANECTFTVQAVQGGGHAIAGPRVVTVYLSDEGAGKGTAASGTVEVASGDAITLVSNNNAWHGITDTDGKAALKVTDTAKSTNYIAVLAAGSHPVLSRQLATADYG